MPKPGCTARWPATTSRGMPPRADRDFLPQSDPCRLVSAHCLAGHQHEERNMTAQANIKERLFNAAAELTDPAQRAAFLDAACGGYPNLRAEIEDLLRHDDAAGGFLSAPALAPDATSGVDPTEPPPREPLVARIGPYR